MCLPFEEKAWLFEISILFSVKLNQKNLEALEYSLEGVDLGATSHIYCFPYSSKVAIIEHNVKINIEFIWAICR